MRRLSCQKISAHGFWLEGATLARREWIALPYELARESGSRLDPMSLRAECDHLVSGLALRRLCRRTVITPRLASIPSLLLIAVLFLFVWFRQALPPGSTLGTWFFLGKFNQRFAQTLPSHSILLGHVVVISQINSINSSGREADGSALARRANRRELISAELSATYSSKPNCSNHRQPN
jgi:hypothetical protein